ncbi:vitamin K epoxide reductase family protein [Gryllotalpicola ginsengisoli]|uniref:vitamin K epoxide reductase family protein n=1 Tax=Gryllotalpicola ginsengisoli TaxID=444608 RepID=UPI000485797B|nr:vitamin K epoxide reductase family protein [Gryllotalpicola ginsengisoli]
MSDPRPARPPYALATWLIIAGLIGLWAAFRLTLDKFDVLENPKASLDCNYSVLVQCTANLQSHQGAVLGFPNPLLGLGGWTATVAMGAIVWAVRGTIARWFWLLFNLGVVGALVLVIYLIHASVYDIHTLCPWCMLTWSVTIPTFWATTLYNLKSGTIPLPASVRAFFAAAYTWTPVITLVSYVVVAVLAQLELNWLSQL